MNWDRRLWIQQCGAGFGAVALNDLLARGVAACDGTAKVSLSVNPLACRPGHFPGTAKRVIFVFMHGGPSHVDTFDYKPLLEKHHGQPLPYAKPRIQFAQTGNLLKSPWKFRQYGQCGAWVSDLFPNVGRCADDITFVKSIHGSNEAHGGALLKMNTGSDTFVRPSMGAWISYGLGTENTSLPSFVTINPTLGHGGVRNFGSAFLPPIHQATRIATSRDNGVTRAQIANLTNGNNSSQLQKLQLKLLRELDGLREQALTADAVGPAAERLPASADSELRGRIDSFELAFRMQTSGPEIFDLSGEICGTVDSSMPKGWGLEGDLS